MHRMCLLCALVLILITAVNGFADKDRPDGMALSEPCPNCLFKFTSDSLQYNDDEMEASLHCFTVDSDGKNVKKLEVVIKISAVDREQYFLYWFPPDSIIANDDFEWDVITQTDNEIYLYVQLWPTNVTQYDGESVFALELFITECLSAADSNKIEALDHFQYGLDDYYSVIIADDYSSYIPSKEPGWRYYETPRLELVVGSDMTPIGCVDSTYVGGIVPVDILFEDINFQYHDGYQLTLAYDTLLTFESITTSDYSGNPTTSAETDSSTMISLGSNSLSRPTSFPERFMTVNLKIEETAEAETEFDIHIKGNHYFYGCENYNATGNVDDEIICVNSVKQLATIWLPDRSVLKGTQDYGYPIFIKSTAPIATDEDTQDLLLRFSFDPSALVKTSYDHVQAEFSHPSGTIYWQDADMYDEQGKFVQESRDYQSACIGVDAVFQQIGSLVIDAGTSTGVDHYDFIVITDYENEDFKKDNFVVIKHTNDTLWAVEDAGVGYIDYGDLTLDSGTITVTSPPPTGCPMLYAWDGAGYILENAILTQSQGKTNPQPADDYYPLKHGIAADNGFYRVEIREWENEISFIDQVELIVVDHPRDATVDISNQGRLFSSRQAIEPIAAIDEQGGDLMPSVGTLDDIWFEAEQPGSMVLTYPNPYFSDGKQAPGSFGLGEVGPDPPVQKKLITDGMTDDGENLFAEIEDIDGNWFYLGGIPPREFRSENSRWLFDAGDAQLGETFRVRVSWKAGYKVDCQALHLCDDADLTVYRISPVAAEHSAAGKIPAELIGDDGDVVTVKPGEKVELRFQVPNQEMPDGFARKFFFKSRGYYKSYRDHAGVPDQYALYDNYPNPFNPSTTIELALPQAGDISLTVINLLGQEVKTLYAGRAEAGRHKFVWDGDNQDGQAVASGVYFYRLRADGFDQSKKMILLK